MNTNLVIYDVDNFLNKYTRFMTKDIYISKTMYDNFLKQYDYLYQRLKKDAILYRENSKYKKMFDIKNKKYNLLKLHNQKYLRKNINKYSSFFNSIVHTNFDNSQKSIILANEDKMIVVNNKNNDHLVIGKVKYLVEKTKIKENKILVITDNNDSNLIDLFQDNGMEYVNFLAISDYKKKILKEKKLISDNIKYNLLLEYIINDLFVDKNKFNDLYSAFSNNIYLNKDYDKYNTFLEYHDYMYKRMFLSSKLSLKRFIEKEINKRKKYLRTINNELVNNNMEVDIANYIYLCGIPYKYDNKEKLFLIKNNKDVFLKIKVENNNPKDNKFICINEKNFENDNYKKIIKDELELKKIRILNMSDEDIYNNLKNSMIDNYFKEFINNYLIKYLDYYDINNNFDNIKINDKQKDVIKHIYNYYKGWMIKNNFITDRDISLLIEQEVNANNYKYVIIISDILLNFNCNNLKIINDYNSIGYKYIKTNIKLLYDYKSYLNDNKALVTFNSFIDEKEIDDLTNKFLDNNSTSLTNYFLNEDKKISIYLYDDSNRLHISKNISKICYELVRKYENILIGINKDDNINSLIYKNNFGKIDKKSLCINDKVVLCEELLSLRKNYDKIILPFLIKDNYHENLTDIINSNLIRLIIYFGISKCKSELILLVPKKRKKEVMKLIKKIKNVDLFE